MLNRRKIVLIVGLFMLPTLCATAFAAERTAQEATGIAADFLDAHNSASRKRALVKESEVRLLHQRMKTDEQNAAFYVFNREKEGGYVVVSADDRVNDILCYSEEGSFDADNLNPSFAWWLDRYAQQISALDEVAENTQERTTVSVSPISPLLGKIAWDQATPYNKLCPIDPWDSETSLTGCVATGAAQIMRYWKYPTVGTGTKSYTCYFWNDKDQKQSKVLSISFDTVPFDWKNMLESYKVKYTKEQANAVARLMYATGVACGMQYASETYGGSAAWTDDMAFGLATYFDYTYDSLISQYKNANEYKSDKQASPAVPIKYNVKNFTVAFNASLEKGCPILMGGAGIGGGHEFVCDGRDENGLFHINWGWGGTSNNYCYLDTLKPKDTKYWFYSGLDAIVGLRPLHQPSSVERIKSPEDMPQKLLINGQFYILRKGKYLTIQGQEKCQM